MTWLTFRLKRDSFGCKKSIGLVHVVTPLLYHLGHILQFELKLGTHASLRKCLCPNSLDFSFEMILDVYELLFDIVC